MASCSTRKRRVIDFGPQSGRVQAGCGGPASLFLLSLLALQAGLSLPGRGRGAPPESKASRPAHLRRARCECRFRAARKLPISSPRTCRRTAASQRDVADGNASEPRCFHTGVPRWSWLSQAPRARPSRARATSRTTPAGARDLSPASPPEAELQIRVLRRSRGAQAYRLRLLFVLSVGAPCAP